MRDAHDPTQRSTREIAKPVADDRAAHTVALARSEAHKRWIGEETDDGACRGFD